MKLALLISLAAASAALAQPLYTVTDLGRMPGYTYSTFPLDINNRGEVVGFAQGGATYQAFIWDASRGMRALPPVPTQESRSSTALAINDNGDIIGFSGQSGGSNIVGWVYHAGQYTILGSIPGYNGALPSGINNNMEVVGRATGFDSLAPYTNFYWSPATGMINPVPGSQAEFYDINDSGIICGGFRSGNAEGITTWNMRTGAVSDLGILPGAGLALGYSINASGRVAGVNTFYDISGHATAHPVYASPETGVVDLSIFQSAGIGINNLGDIVGSRPFASNSTYYSWLYSPARGTILDLQAVVQDAAHFSQVSSARAINDAGQIVATGNNGNFPTDLSRRGLVLTPIPAPCYANCDASTLAPILTANDFQCFLNKFAAKDPYANCDGSTIAPTLTANDFQCFLNAYAAGCR